MNLKELIGSGEKIGLFTLPFIIVGLILNFMFPGFFSIGGPNSFLKTISIIILIPGIINWVWSAYLILTEVPRKELITKGPYSLVKHPLYTGVAILVLPWFGFIFDTWLGAFLGVILYIASRKFSIEEETKLAKTFGASWEQYKSQVKIPWL